MAIFIIIGAFVATTIAIQYKSSRRSRNNNRIRRRPRLSYDNNRSRVDKILKSL